MADKNDAPPPTRAVMFGQELPRPDADLYGKTDPLPMELKVRLHLESGPNAPAVAPMKGSVLVLGRGAGVADIDVGDESASRRHAYIAYRGGKLTLNDMGSTNGTYLNGKVVGSSRLKDGDEIQIGTAIMRFEVKKR